MTNESCVTRVTAPDADPAELVAELSEAAALAEVVEPDDELADPVDPPQPVTARPRARTAVIADRNRVLRIKCPFRFRGVRHGVFEGEDVPAPA
jgi:hypothetical protein